VTATPQAPVWLGPLEKKYDRLVEAAFAGFVFHLMMRRIGLRP
jgi:hypothetical protein